VTELATPGRSNGLLDVFRWRFLLSLLVRKELRVRYRGSVLGLFWSYVKPGMQLLVFYVAMGKFLRLEHELPNFVIYLFSGIVIVNFFSEVFNNTTRSIVWNADLVKKIYMPRELFPVASLWVAIVHLLPQLVVLMIAAFFGGWRPGPLNIAAGLLALLITMACGLGLGLLFGGLNVLFRDSENFVDLILMMATWLSPVLYTWEKVRNALPETLWTVYQLNPGTIAVQLAHYAFWLPAENVETHFATTPGSGPVAPGFGWWVLVAVVASTLVLVTGQVVFRRLEGRFAQEL
jgi:ABC-2 type transport system permease protein